MLLKAICLVCIFTATAFAIDLETLKDYKTSFKIAVNNTNVVDSTVVRLVNAGIAAVANGTGCIQKIDTVITTDGNSDYALNADFHRNGIVSVELKKDGQRKGLSRIKSHEIGELGSEWGCPQVYSEYAGYLTVSPEGTPYACTLIVRYQAEAPFMDTDSNTIQIPSDYGWLAVQAAKFEYQKAVDIQINQAEFSAWTADIAMIRALLMPQPDVAQ